jgi:hypothetical protein
MPDVHKRSVMDTLPDYVEYIQPQHTTHLRHDEAERRECAALAEQIRQRRGRIILASA